ncbi:MAG: hypothetical protein E6J32_13320 [Chloroflexi bacterium]|nr:MAG: hypothetical protein E6J32_13320 [Chloroflexota bacterium]
MRIGLFVEDAGHLAFIRALVERVVSAEQTEAEILERNAVGGRGAALSSLRSYLRDVTERRDVFVEILVAGIDGNCHGYQERCREIITIVERAEYPGLPVCAVPDPHVEIWYLADGQAVARACGGVGRQPGLPRYKCEPEYYKTLLREAFLVFDIDPPAGGTEFGDDIGSELVLDVARRNVESLDAFLSDLRAAIRQIRAASA